MNGQIREQIENDEEKLLTHPLATKSGDSLGREKEEEEDPIRPCFERDAHRILYSTPFRRLRYKTQVFFNPEHDHISTRVDHSLFVASISRTVARSLGLNTDLAYAIALGHDVGHGPFGHAGEEMIQTLAQEVEEKFSFQHEIHGLRVVDRLTFRPSTREHGLNLTCEVRDGIVCHWGEERTQQYISPRPKRKNLELSKIKKRGKNPCTVEACVVRMVDRIAYIGRDVEDARVVLRDIPDLPSSITKVLGSSNRSIINTLVHDLINESNKNRKEGKVGFSDKIFAALVKLYDYNLVNIYKHPKILGYAKKADAILRAIFDDARNELDSKNRSKWGSGKKDDPIPVQKLHKFIMNTYTEDEKNEISVIQTIVDYLSLMTDRFALRMFEHLVMPEPFK